MNDLAPPNNKKLTPKNEEIKHLTMGDNTTGPDMCGTEQVEAGLNARPGAVPVPQADYRNLPNLGETSSTSGDDSPFTTQPAVDYDHPNAAGFLVPPQPDAAIRSYDLSDKSYNTMDPNQLGNYDQRPGGYSPDIGQMTDWERKAGGPTGMDGYGCQPDPQSSMP